MNFVEFVGMEYNNETFNKFWEAAVNKIGLNNLKDFMPYNTSILKEHYNISKHFNNNDLRSWDCMAIRLGYILPSYGITSSSLSQRVCLLKEAARMLVENAEVK